MMEQRRYVPGRDEGEGTKSEAKLHFAPTITPKLHPPNSLNQGAL